MGQVCPLCVLDDYVASTAVPDGTTSYQCTNPKHQPYSWIGHADGGVEVTSEGGLAQELGMFDDLLECVQPEDGWLEYGIVEHRYSQLNAEAFQELVERYGHRTLAPKAGRHFTASSYIAMILGNLRDKGRLQAKWGKATGFWSYNGQVSYWSVPNTLMSARSLTFEEFISTIK